jgi:histidinol phosphatase-like enzyme
MEGTARVLPPDEPSKLIAFGKTWRDVGLAIGAVQRIIGLDFDGTLVRPFTAEPLPRVRDVLHALRDRGERLIVITNQAGPTWRLATGDDKFPTAHAVAANIKNAFAALDWLPDMLVVCVASGNAEIDGMYNHEHAHEVAHQMEAVLMPLFPDPMHQQLIVTTVTSWRKPNPGALEFCDIDLYVGDRGEDVEAAQLAGVDFAWAREFFTRRFV